MVCRCNYPQADNPLLIVHCGPGKGAFYCSKVFKLNVNPTESMGESILPKVKISKKKYQRQLNSFVWKFGKTPFFALQFRSEISEECQVKSKMEMKK